MIVKICGITRREDAEVAVDAGASAIGFIFYKPSPRYVTPERAHELGDGLNIWKVGVFVDEKPASIEAIMRAARLDIAQVYGAATVAGRFWKAVRVAGPLPLQEEAEALFLDSSGNGISFDWQLARGAAEKVIIAGGLDASNVAEAIRIAQPWGVDASSRLESAPGIKDHQKVRRFIHAARKLS
jgi:phosphoribosylanthranilate isomerase